MFHICVMAVFIYGVGSRVIQFIYIHVVIQFIICCIYVVGGNVSEAYMWGKKAM